MLTIIGIDEKIEEFKNQTQSTFFPRNQFVNTQFSKADFSNETSHFLERIPKSPPKINKIVITYSIYERSLSTNKWKKKELI